MKLSIGKILATSKMRDFNGPLFKPLLICLFLHGLSGTKKGSQLSRFLFIFYHILWLIGTVGTGMCLYYLSSSFYVFSTIVKIIAWSIWWSVFSTRRKIFRLLKRLAHLHFRITGELPTSSKMIYFSLLVLFVFTLIPGLNNVHSVLTKGKGPGKCFHFNVPLKTRGSRAIVYFAMMTNHQVVNWGLPYLVTVLIIACSLELNVLCKTLAKKWDEHDFDVLYEALLSSFTKMEDCFSLACFFVLMRLFMEFFRIFSLLFNFVKGKPQSVSFVNACSYASVTCTLFTAMIFSSDALSGNLNHLQRQAARKMKNSGYYSGGPVLTYETATLTGWGIFELKKKLLLSTLASLITYGVLLQQLQGP